MQLANLLKYNLIYAATPYSKYPDGPEQAFEDAAVVMADLIRNGLKAYSPICHTHPIAIHGDLDPLDHSIWLPFDEAIMNVCDALLVIQLDGWDQSYGIDYEVDFFDTHGKPVYLLNPYTFDLEALTGTWARPIPAPAEMELAA